MNKIEECAGCGQELRIPTTSGGKKMRCPTCGFEFFEVEHESPMALSQADMPAAAKFPTFEEASQQSATNDEEKNRKDTERALTLLAAGLGYLLFGALVASGSGDYSFTGALSRSASILLVSAVILGIFWERSQHWRIKDWTLHFWIWITFTLLSAFVMAKKMPNKASLLTPDPPPVPAVMTVTVSTPYSTLAPGQA